MQKGRCRRGMSTDGEEKEMRRGDEVIPCCPSDFQYPQ